MSLNVPVLQASFQAVSPKAQELVDTFYEHLFEKNPSVKPLFEKVNLPEQKKMLLQAITTVVHGADKAEALVPVLEEMGSRHVGYGAVEAHYPAVGQSLIYALSKTAGDLWTPELEKAWVDAYGVISKIMIDGARKSSVPKAA